MGKLWSFNILSNLHECDIWCHFCSLCSSNDLSQTIYIPICCIAASASTELMRPNGSRINSVKLWKTLKMNFPRDCCWIIRFISINCMNYMLWGFCGQKIATLEAFYDVKMFSNNSHLKGHLEFTTYVTHICRENHWEPDMKIWNAFGSFKGFDLHVSISIESISSYEVCEELLGVNEF